MYLLDTNTCIHLLKNEYGIAQKVAAIGIDNCYLSEIVLLELMYGVENSASSRKEENQLRLQTFISLFQPNILPVRVAFESFARQKIVLRKAGTPISDFDLLIGCTALAENLVLISRNTREMERIEGLQLENWVVD